MEELIKKLEALDITLSESDDGSFTVYTTSEPLFCFVRNDPTLRVYAVDAFFNYNICDYCRLGKRPAWGYWLFNPGHCRNSFLFNL